MSSPENPKIKAGADESVPSRLRTKVVAIDPVLQPKTAIEVAWLNTPAGILSDKTW